MTPSTDIPEGKATPRAGNMLRFFRKRRGFTLAVLLPTLLAVLYLCLIASSRWESESKVTVKNNAMPDASPSGLSFLLGASPAVREDVMFLREFILSPDMFEHLDKAVQLRKKYANAGADILFRLPEDATRERAIKYYRRHVEANYDDINGVLTVITQGFSPADAKQVNEEILAESERFLNGISQRIAKDQVAFLDRQIQSAAQRMSAAREAVVEFQAKHRLLDPVKQGEAGTKLVVQLGTELVASEAELRALQTVFGDEAPQIVNLKAKISSLRAQVAKEESSITGGNDKALNGIAAKFQDLRTEAELTLEIYRLSITEIEKSKINAIKKSKSLVVISAPYLPQEATVPNRPVWLILFFIGALCIFVVGRHAFNHVRDHSA